MSSGRDELSRRPDRVIILDADDPMTEVYGRFVWQEEHDRVVDVVRQQAYAEGHEAGRNAALSTPVQVTWRRRRTLRDRMRLILTLLLALFVLLMLPVIFL